MAMSTSSADAGALLAPRWPKEPIDPSRVWTAYDVPADEFLIYFGGRPVASTCDPLDAPGFEDVAIMIGLDADSQQTGEIVGVQVIPMLLSAVEDQPSWAALAWATLADYHGTELLRERLPAFFDAVHDAFDRYWTPPLPMEEQLAAIERARQERAGSG
jgi:hypothetical protein